MTDDSGQVVHTYQYDAWGNIEQGAEVGGYGFTGREWDPETGLYYYRARYYDPDLGRFISDDPIGFAGGANFYAYVKSSPVSLSDPTGFRWKVPPGMGTGGEWDFDPSEGEYTEVDYAVDDFIVGFADAFTFNVPVVLRSIIGVDGGVNRCSTAYRAGSWTAVGVSLMRALYVGLARGLAVAASSGAQASARRTALKSAFRLGIATEARTPNLAKYSTDAALQAAAGRTNPGVNAIAAAAGGTGAANGSGCGCQ